MQGLNQITMRCTYSTPCGWCTKWDKKCDKKIGCGNWFTPEFEDYVTKILAMFQTNQYVCSICGKIISPEVKFEKDSIVIESEQCELCGGLGNKVLKDHICSDCKSKIGL